MAMETKTRETVKPQEKEQEPVEFWVERRSNGDVILMSSVNDRYGWSIAKVSSETGTLYRYSSIGGDMRDAGMQLDGSGKIISEN